MFGTNVGRQEAPFYSHFFDPWGSSRNRNFYSRQSSSMQMRRLFSEGDSGKKTTSSTPIHTKPTEQQQQQKKNVPDIQPSKTHKVETHDGETKKQIKGTKIVVNSVVEQNVVNPSENAAAKATKVNEGYVTLPTNTLTPNSLTNLCVKLIL